MAGKILSSKPPDHGARVESTLSGTGGSCRMSAAVAVGILCLGQVLSAAPSLSSTMTETRQITRNRTGHILTNTGVWSPDGEWIVFDTRSDPAGDTFDGTRIQMVNVRSGKVKTLYESRQGAYCGVVTFHPHAPKVVFILGPENPTPDWSYNAFHRQGVIVDLTKPRQAIRLDARDLIPPFTPGALRGGSHVHVWHPAGDWVSFTYEDHVLAQFKTATPENEVNLRNIGISIPNRPVTVSRDHPRNHDGTHFTVLATRTTANPGPGSDEIKRAFEEGWVGTNGYVRTDGSRQTRALAFQGHVVTLQGETISELFLLDLPNDLTQADNGPLAGTATRSPAPPKGVIQRRLTFTADRKHPGIQGPRHWIRGSPDGTKLACLMKDDTGVVQLWLVSPHGGPPQQLTRNTWGIASAFTWSPDGRHIAHAMDRSVCVTEVPSGQTICLTDRAEEAFAPRPEACVFSPTGREIAWVRPVVSGRRVFNQIFVTRMPE